MTPRLRRFKEPSAAETELPGTEVFTIHFVASTMLPSNESVKSESALERKQDK
jgi:hypothetical protein